MFEWISRIISANPITALSIPSILSSVNFFTHLLTALSDGVITPDEYHQLSTSANGVELLILAVIMMALKNKANP